jgi:hypothetical protein
MHDKLDSLTHTRSLKQALNKNNQFPKRFIAKMSQKMKKKVKKDEKQNS